jgi:hypothetical protein
MISFPGGAKSMFVVSVQTTVTVGDDQGAILSAEQQVFTKVFSETSTLKEVAAFAAGLEQRHSSVTRVSLSPNGVEWYQTQPSQWRDAADFDE